MRTRPHDSGSCARAVSNACAPHGTKEDGPRPATYGDVTISENGIVIGELAP